MWPTLWAVLCPMRGTLMCGLSIGVLCSRVVSMVAATPANAVSAPGAPGISSVWPSSVKDGHRPRRFDDLSVMSPVSVAVAR